MNLNKYQVPNIRSSSIYPELPTYR